MEKEDTYIWKNGIGETFARINGKMHLGNASEGNIYG